MEKSIKKGGLIKEFKIKVLGVSLYYLITCKRGLRYVDYKKHPLISPNNQSCDKKI